MQHAPISGCETNGGRISIEIQPQLSRLNRQRITLPPWLLPATQAKEQHTANNRELRIQYLKGKLSELSRPCVPALLPSFFASTLDKGLFLSHLSSNATKQHEASSNRSVQGYIAMNAISSWGLANACKASAKEKTWKDSATASSFKCSQVWDGKKHATGGNRWKPPFRSKYVGGLAASYFKRKLCRLVVWNCSNPSTGHFTPSLWVTGSSTGSSTSYLWHS